MVPDEISHDCELVLEGLCVEVVVSLAMNFKLRASRKGAVKVEKVFENTDLVTSETLTVAVSPMKSERR